MPCFAGLDVSKKTTHICIMDRDGAILRQGVVETTPKAIVGFLRGERRRYVRVGMETGSMADWLHGELSKAGLPIICLEGRRAAAALKGQRNKTDRIDAQGIATLVRSGNYRTVHMKSGDNREIRATLAARQLMLDKTQDVENVIRSLLLGSGLKLPRLSQNSFEQGVRQILTLNATVRAVIEPLLRVRAAMVVEKRAFDASLDAIASKDPVCKRLMTAPQVGALTALVFRCAIDEPRRFASSRAVGAHFGITPKTKQSGETSRRGRITGWGDASVRRMLVLAARGLFRKKARPSWLTEWAAQVAARRGTGKAIVAAARRLAVILHHMWISETDFRWEAPI